MADYDARFEQGQLRQEADFARVEALLASGQALEALAVLERLEAQPALAGPSAARAQLIRAETLLALERAAEALPLFQATAKQARVLDWQERALWGQAASELALSRRDQARATLQTYLARFPQGRHASDAKRLVSGL